MATMKIPTQNRSEKSARAIVEAALDIAAQDGLAAVTIAKVASVSNTSNGSIYHRFGNHDNLLLAASDHLLTRLETQFRTDLVSISAEVDDTRAIRMLVDANRRLFLDRLGALRAFMFEGRGSPALDARGYQASQRVGIDLAVWLVARFGVSRRVAALVFRMLFADGALSLLVDRETDLTEAGLTADVSANYLAQTIQLQLGGTDMSQIGDNLFDAASGD